MNMPSSISLESTLSLDTSQLDTNSRTSSSGRQALASAVSAINQSGLWPGRELRIRTDTSTHSLTVQIVNSETDEVMEQIPSELALRLASELKQTRSSDEEVDTTA